MANRAQRRAVEHGPKAPPCPETGGRHSFQMSGSQVTPMPGGDVVHIVIWSCPCGATKINQAKIGEGHAGLAIPGAGVPAELLKGIQR